MPGDIGSFHYWVYSSASMGDFDDDGDYDLIVGGSGGLRISENIGGRNSPSFAERRPLLDINGEPLRILNKPSTQPFPEGEIPPPDGDGKSNPTVADWNNDGVLDLLVTGSYRHPASQAVTFFRGVKTSAGHRFHPGVDLLKAEGGAKALPGSGPRVYVDDWNGDGVQDLLIGASVATVNGGEFSDELSWEWEDVNEVESAGKDPGLYPPRPKPTAESMKDMLDRVAKSQSEEEAQKMLAFNVEYWEKSVGRLYKEGKAHWLTMRHQGRIYVMLGRQPNQDQARSTPAAPAPTAAEPPPVAPVRVKLETAARGEPHRAARALRHPRRLVHLRAHRPQHAARHDRDQGAVRAAAGGGAVGRLAVAAPPLQGPVRHLRRRRYMGTAGGGPSRRAAGRQARERRRCGCPGDLSNL